MSSNDKLDIKVAVLMGGVGPERPVSLESGKNIAAALSLAGIEAAACDITPDNLDILNDRSIDVFFLALHGPWGEDGQLQQILEDRELIYTGSSAAASRIAFDKVKSKEVFAAAGITVPWSIAVDGDTYIPSLKDVLAPYGDRFVVKPVAMGSSCGVEILASIPETLDAAARCVSKFGPCMIEQFIAGRELTVGVVNGRALPIIEIRSKSGFYDYTAKYVDNATEYLFDTVTDSELIEKLQSTAVECFNCIACRHLSRVDFILSEDGTAYVLEINTLPGFTSHSLLPKAAEKTGVSQSDLCLEILRAAWEEA